MSQHTTDALKRIIAQVVEQDRDAAARAMIERRDMLARIHALPMVRYADRPEDAGYGRCVP
jgi:hypothetical protein